MAGTAPGKLIVLEGLDGSGKGAQMTHLISWFKEQQLPFLSTREPGGTPIGEDIRNVLLSIREGHMDARTEFFLYSASRAQLVSDVITPTLAQGINVLADRYDTSSAVYQGIARGLGVDAVLHISALFSFPRPDRLYIIDVPFEVALKRQQWRGKEKDRIEQESIDFFERIRQGYLDIASHSRYSDVVRVIDGTPDEHTVHRTVVQDIVSLYPDRFSLARLS